MAMTEATITVPPSRTPINVPQLVAGTVLGAVVGMIVSVVLQPRLEDRWFRIRAWLDRGRTDTPGPEVEEAAEVTL